MARVLPTAAGLNCWWPSPPPRRKTSFAALCGVIGQKLRDIYRLPYHTQKCRFMGKEVREISRFFVAPPRMFAPAVWASFTHFLTHKYLHLSIHYMIFTCGEAYRSRRAFYCRCRSSQNLKISKNTYPLDSFRKN